MKYSRIWIKYISLEADLPGIPFIFTGGKNYRIIYKIKYNEKRLYRYPIVFCTAVVYAQNNVIDKIIAIVGEEIILKSDIENEFLHEQGQGLISASSDYRAEILERQLIQKLLLAQARLDSISVTEDEVENEVNSRIQYLMTNIGSRERLETYFGKNIEEIKSDMRAPIREKLITESMQQHIVDKIRSTPSEVKAFFKKLPKDSCRMYRINTKYNRSL